MKPVVKKKKKGRSRKETEALLVFQWRVLTSSSQKVFWIRFTCTNFHASWKDVNRNRTWRLQQAVVSERCTDVSVVFIRAECAWSQSSGWFDPSAQCREKSVRTVITSECVTAFVVTYCATCCAPEGCCLNHWSDHICLLSLWFLWSHFSSTGRDRPTTQRWHRVILLDQTLKALHAQTFSL